jgi:hypothetical protein
MILNTSHRTRRRGVSLVLVVISLVSLIGLMAISLEGGLLLTEKRNAQATADAAAMAAAADLYYNHFANAGVDTGGTARLSAFTAATANGYTNDGVNTKVTVNIPPLSGDYVGRPSYAEVIVEYYHTRGFSSIFGTSKVAVVARTVAVGKPAAGNVGILVLDPTVKSAFNANGGGDIIVKKVPIVVNSTSPEGSIAGGGSQVSAPDYELVGNYTTSGGGQFFGPITTGVQPMEDPLRYLPPPDPSKLTLQSHKKEQFTSGTHYLQPGVYKGGINASSTANVILAPGIYYMDGGGFSFTGGGSLTGQGVMIYNAPGNGNADGINISANGSVNLSPPTTGIYKGVLLFQDRTSTVSANISGGSNMNITGTFYFANALLTVTGSAGFTNFGSQYISRTLNAQGTGNIYIDWDPNLVGQIRLITIVE